MERQQLSRRGFLTAAAVGAAAAGAAWGDNLVDTVFGKYRDGRVPAEDLSQRMLTPLAGETLAVVGRGAELTVTDVSDVKVYDDGPTGRREVFHVALEGPTALGQDTYELRSDRIGTFPLFIVPIGEPRSRSQRFEAIFNRV